MSDSLFDVVQLNPKGGNVSIEMLLTIAGVFISIASAFWAYLSAKAGQESLRKLFKTPIFERGGKQFCLN